jgi:NAD-dependent dihydropyrimidine dehydrogenase PreA subunit
MSLVHAITDEQSRLRRWSLYIFARYLEMPLLAAAYALLRGRLRRIGRNRVVRAIFGWTVAAPFGYAGDTARPMPTAEVLRLIEALDGPIAVGPCRCRAAHGACDHPIETDIVIRTGVHAWTRAFPDDYRIIDKAEAGRIVSECSQLGLWPMVFVHCPVHAHEEAHAHDNEYVICNCCTCGCVPYILNRELGQRVYPLLRGDHVARTDPNRCTGRGTCVDACPFGVRALENGKVRLVKQCFGCGACVAACPEDAIKMQPAQV